jgi:hypothetical protein
MSLKDDFNKLSLKDDVFKGADHILYYNSYPQYKYDFLSRLLTVTYSSGGVAISVTPFSQLDQETLEVMRDKLIELGGKPPALPETGFQKPSQPRNNV